MKIAVRYFTRSGNTEKLARAIAGAVGVEAKDLSHPLCEDVDILFLGSSLYAFHPDPAVSTYIDGICVKVGKVVNFSTAASPASTYKQVKKLLAARNIPVAEENFSCQGEFGIMNRGRPNEKDLQKAAEFARAMVR